MRIDADTCAFSNQLTLLVPPLSPDPVGGCKMQVDTEDECNEFREPNEDRDGITENEENEEEEDDELCTRRQTAINGLENFALSFLSQLTDALQDVNLRQSSKKEVRSTQTRTGKKRIVLELANRRSSQDGTAAAVKRVCFPRNIKGSCGRSPAQLFKVINEAHEALIYDVPVTKRDLYYKDVSLFKKQCVVDNIVDDIAATLALNRSDLNVRASLKGLYCGSALTIHLNDGTTLTGNDGEASLIPAAQDIEQFEISDDIGWILIIEKDAVFQTLRQARLSCHPSLPGRGLLITGKGYPDVATRQLVKSLSDNLPERVRILALVDADAYGLEIVSVYKYGSINMSHENDSLAADRVEWIGVSAYEALSMGVDRDAFLPLSTRDARKAVSLLSSRNDIPSPWRRELMQMLHTRRKAEIEILSSSSAFQNSSSDLAYSVSSNESVPPLLQYVIGKINSSSED